MKTGKLLEMLASEFAFYHMDVETGYDADDFALMYEYIYRYGKQAQDDGVYWLYEPDVIFADYDNYEIYDTFVPCHSAGPRGVSLLNGCPERHLLAVRLWRFLAFSSLGNDHPWGPIQVGALDEILQFLRCFVDAWCEGACDSIDSTVSECSNEDVYTLVVNILRSDDNTIPIVDDDHKVRFYELEQ